MQDDQLGQVEIEELRGHLQRLGETGCARSLTVSRLSLVRAIAGLRLQRGTLALIRLQLREGAS